jgi:hypothetical protein
MPQSSRAFAGRYRSPVNGTYDVVQPGCTVSSEYRVFFSGDLAMRQLLDASSKSIANAAG